MCNSIIQTIAGFAKTIRTAAENMTKNPSESLTSIALALSIIVALGMSLAVGVSGSFALIGGHASWAPHFMSVMNTAIASETAWIPYAMTAGGGYGVIHCIVCGALVLVIKCEEEDFSSFLEYAESFKEELKKIITRNPKSKKDVETSAREEKDVEDSENFKALGSALTLTKDFEDSEATENVEISFEKIEILSDLPDLSDLSDLSELPELPEVPELVEDAENAGNAGNVVPTFPVEILNFKSRGKQ